MGIFGKLGAALIETVTLPLAVAADVVTLGGTLNDKNETYTGAKGRNIVSDIEEAADEARD